MPDLKLCRTPALLEPRTGLTGCLTGTTTIQVICLKLTASRRDICYPGLSPQRWRLFLTMAVLNFVSSPWAPALLLVGLAVYYLFPYFVTYRHLRKIPSPFPAQFSDLWLLSVCRRRKRYEVVDQVHKRLGPVVRIQPNHVSINDDDAISVIYGHGNGFLKS